VTVAPEPDVAVTVLSGGTATTGPVVSSTVTVKELSPLLPALSDAEHVTVVVPSGNTDPDSVVQVAVTGPSTSSSAVTPV